MQAIADSHSHIDVSIIILSWNTQAILRQCIDSVYANTKNIIYEIIVVDNASSDGSPELIEKNFPDIRLIKNKENIGFARANNIGISQSNGRYVCLINSDVFISDSCIQTLMNFMDSQPTAGLVGPRILNTDHTLQVSCRHFPTIWNNLCQALGLNHLFPKAEIFSEPFMKYWAHDQVRKVDILSGCFWMIRRKALDQVGLLDEDFFFYGEDMDWCRRFHQAGWDVVFCPKAEAVHVGGASSSNAPIRFYIELQKADLYYWKKHHGPFGRFVYAAVILLRQTMRIIYGAILYVIRPSERRMTSFKLNRSLACIRSVLHI